MVLADSAVDVILWGFTLFLWRALRMVQTESLCPDGAGFWKFFGTVNPVGLSTTASITAFTMAVLVSIWNCLSMIADLARLWQLRPEDVTPKQWLIASQFHPVAWWIMRMFQSDSQRYVARFRLIQFYLTRLIQISIVIYVFRIVEGTVSVNELEKSEDGWGFTQIFALLNLLFTGIVVVYRILNRILRAVLSGFLP